MFTIKLFGKTVCITAAVCSLLLFTACGDDDTPVTPKPLSFTDEHYDITYYNYYPHADIEQGYMFVDGFIECEPNTQPPFTMLIEPIDETGKEIMAYFASPSCKVITDVSDASNGFYKVTANYYLESPHLYVSNKYMAKMPSNYSLFVNHPMKICIEKDKDIRQILDTYDESRGVEVELYREYQDKTTYKFTSHCTNSCDLLQLSVKLSNHEGVLWAEPEIRGADSWVLSDITAP